MLKAAAVGAGATAVLPATSYAARAAEPATDGPILKPLPERYFVDYGTNAEMKWDSVDHRRYLTPQPRLFVRNHTKTPRIDPDTYRLSIFGDGLRTERDRSEAVELSLRDLRRLRVTRTTTRTSAPATGAASTAPSRGRLPPARSGSSARSAPSRGRACGSRTCCTASASRGTRST